MAIVGFGVMGRCIASGLLDSGTLTPSQIQGTVALGESIDPFQGIKVSHGNEDAIKWANVVLLRYIFAITCETFTFQCKAICSR